MPEPVSSIAVPFKRIVNVRRLVLLVAATVLSAALLASAQEGESKSNLPDAPSANQKQKDGKGGASQFLNGLERRSRFFPDLAATQGPLTAGQKFKLFVADSISPSAILGSALTSAIGQGTNTPEGYGQGWDAYGKRFGASMARQASSEFFGSFVLASMLKQDPRFFPQENPSFSGSVKYSLERVVITRNDRGQDVANWSGLIGPLMSEGLANMYWPENERTVGDTFRRYGVDLAGRAGANMLRNYWPVFFRRLGGSRQSKASN